MKEDKIEISNFRKVFNRILLSLIAIACAFTIVHYISASSVQIYYSPTCPHCQEYLPVAKQIIDGYGVSSVFTDITQGSYLNIDIEAVPLTVIKTNYCRTVEFTGNNPKRLNCELQEMSTPECATKSADTKLHKGESWFLI